MASHLYLTAHPLAALTLQLHRHAAILPCLLRTCYSVHGTCANWHKRLLIISSLLAALNEDLDRRSQMGHCSRNY